MFDENLPFFQVIKILKSHFEIFADQIKLNLKQNHQEKKIVEIGCNDGIMLKNFMDKQEFEHLGIEPSKNVLPIKLKKS